MPIRTRIAQIAKERGLTAAEVARRLGLYPSNLSAMDAGKRAVSLRGLLRISEFLNCSVSDLLEVSWGPETDFPAGAKLQQRLKERDSALPDGEDRSWVHTAQLAWQRHFQQARPLS